MFRGSVRFGFGAALAFLLMQAGGATGADAPDGKIRVTECDVLASHPFDYERAAPPVPVIKYTAKALLACEKALDKHPGHPRFQFLMGRLRDMEERNYWELSSGLPYLEDSAAQGYIAAHYLLGEINRNIWGRGRRKVGFNHMMKAARAGHLEAMARIGNFAGRRSAYEHQDEIFEMVNKAIARGHSDAMATLAKAYIFILGRTDKHEESVELLYKAEKMGSLEAMAILGQLQTFESVPAGIRNYIDENTFGGLRRLLKAGKKGNRKAAFILGMLYSGTTFAIPRDKEKMIRWLCRAGPRGQYMVAEMLEKDVRKYRCPKNLSG